MSEQTLAENGNLVSALPASADLFNGVPESARVTAAHHERLDYVLRAEGTDAAAATATVTISAASDSGGTGAEDIPFKLAKGGADEDVMSDLADVAAAGFVTDANEDRTYVACVDTDALPVGKPFVAIKLTELVDGAVRGYCLLSAHPSRMKGGTGQTIL